MSKIRYKAYPIQGNSGNQTKQFQQPGDARQLLGINIQGRGAFGTLTDDLNFTSGITFIVNADTVLDSVPLGLLIPYDNPNIPNGFIQIDRPLSGNDSLSFTLNLDGGAEYLVATIMYKTA